MNFYEINLDELSWDELLELARTLKRYNGVTKETTKFTIIDHEPKSELLKRLKDLQK